MLDNEIEVIYRDKSKELSRLIGFITGDIRIAATRGHYFITRYPESCFSDEVSSHFASLGFNVIKGRGLTISWDKEIV